MAVGCLLDACVEQVNHLRKRSRETDTISIVVEPYPDLRYPGQAPLQASNLLSREPSAVLNDRGPSLDRLPDVRGHRTKFLDDVLVNEDDLPEIRLIPLCAQ